MGRDFSRGVHVPHVLSEDERAALLRACTTPFERAVMGLLIEGGLRPREVCALQAGDLRRDAVHARGKDGRKRRVALSLDLSEALQICVHERGAVPMADGPLLLATDGRPMDVGALGALVRAVARRANLSEHLSAHALRATAVQRRWQDPKRGHVDREQQPG